MKMNQRRSVLVMLSGEEGLEHEWFCFKKCSLIRNQENTFFKCSIFSLEE